MMLNLNAKIRVQKPELAFRDEHLINFLLASKPFTYVRIFDNLNIRNTMKLNGEVRVLRTKKTELTDLGATKEESTVRPLPVPELPVKSDDIYRATL